MTEISNEEGQFLNKPTSFASKRSTSQHSGMQSSVFRFKNVNFVAGKGDSKKHLLQNVSGTVKYGRELICYFLSRCAMSCHLIISCSFVSFDQ